VSHKPRAVHLRLDAEAAFLDDPDAICLVAGQASAIAIRDVLEATLLAEDFEENFWFRAIAGQEALQAVTRSNRCVHRRPHGSTKGRNLPGPNDASADLAAQRPTGAGSRESGIHLGSLAVFTFCSVKEIGGPSRAAITAGSDLRSIMSPDDAHLRCCFERLPEGLRNNQDNFVFEPRYLHLKA
jgi:hypothetical protein